MCWINFLLTVLTTVWGTAPPTVWGTYMFCRLVLWFFKFEFNWGWERLRYSSITAGSAWQLRLWTTSPLFSHCSSLNWASCFSNFSVLVPIWVTQMIPILSATQTLSWAPSRLLLSCLCWMSWRHLRIKQTARELSYPKTSSLSLHCISLGDLKKGEDEAGLWLVVPSTLSFIVSEHVFMNEGITEVQFMEREWRNGTMSPINS